MEGRKTSTPRSNSMSRDGSSTLELTMSQAEVVARKVPIRRLSSRYVGLEEKRERYAK